MIGAGAFSMVSLVIANGMIWSFAASWNRPMPDGLVGGELAAGGRGVLLGAAAGLAGFSLVLIARHTAAALGLIALYGLAGEAVLRAVWKDSERWLISNHVIAFVGGASKRSVYGSCNALSACHPTVYRFSLAPSAVYLAVVALVVALASLMVFHRRDVA